MQLVENKSQGVNEKERPETLQPASFRGLHDEWFSLGGLCSDKESFLGESGSSDGGQDDL